MRLHQWTVLLFFGAASAYASDKLLPTNEARAVRVSYSQDGRAVHVTLTNSSTFVLTSATVVCWHGKVSYLSACQPKRPGDCELVGLQKYSPNFKGVRLVPGKTREEYFESEGKISGCEIQEVRGREKRFFDVF